MTGIDASAIAIVVRSTIVLAAGLAAARALRSQHPARRHLVLLIAARAALIAPIASLSMPQIDAGILPAVSAPNVSVTRFTAPLPSAVVPTAKVSEGVAVRPAPRSSLMIDYETVALATYALGGLLVLAYVVIGRVRLRSIAKLAIPLTSDSWARVLSDEARRAGVTRRVHLLMSELASTPLTWGTIAPVILVPADAGEWDDAHRRVVLRHEMAHIARYDACAQTFTTIMCAIHWFNPLAWQLSSRMRLECERACDNRVVGSGTNASDYAMHLLEVARSARSLGPSAVHSVAMARPSQLEGRLVAVLQQSAVERVTMQTRIIAIASGVLLVASVSAFRPVPRSAVVAADVVPLRMVSATTNAAQTSVVQQTHKRADTTFVSSVPAASGGMLTIDINATGGALKISSWDEPRVRVRMTLAGKSWRDAEATLSGGPTDAALRTRYIGNSRENSFANSFEIQVPKSYNLDIRSAGGSVDIREVDGHFEGSTAGGTIRLEGIHGVVHLGTGGGDVRVTSSNVSGSVSTGGGKVDIDNTTGDLTASSGTGEVYYDGRVQLGPRLAGARGVSKSRTTVNNVNETTTYLAVSDALSDSYGARGVQKLLAGGDIILSDVHEGGRLITGGGKIRIGDAGGELYASTGGGAITIGHATGSVIASTGAGDIDLTLDGGQHRVVDLQSGTGDVELHVATLKNATLILETAYTESLGRKTRITSNDRAGLSSTETSFWDSREGTPRKYVRSETKFGNGESVVKVRTLNGDIRLDLGPLIIKDGVIQGRP